MQRQPYYYTVWRSMLFSENIYIPLGKSNICLEYCFRKINPKTIRRILELEQKTPECIVAAQRYRRTIMLVENLADVSSIYWYTYPSYPYAEIRQNVVKSKNIIWSDCFASTICFSKKVVFLLLGETWKPCHQNHSSHNIQEDFQHIFYLLETGELCPSEKCTKMQGAFALSNRRPYFITSSEER